MWDSYVNQHEVEEGPLTGLSTAWHEHGCPRRTRTFNTQIQNLVCYHCTIGQFKNWERNRASPSGQREVSALFL
jgi:hypothetical protein